MTDRKDTIIDEIMDRLNGGGRPIFFMMQDQQWTNYAHVLILYINVSYRVGWLVGMNKLLIEVSEWDTHDGHENSIGKTIFMNIPKSDKVVELLTCIEDKSGRPIFPEWWEELK